MSLGIPLSLIEEALDKKVLMFLIIMHGIQNIIYVSKGCPLEKVTLHNACFSYIARHHLYGQGMTNCGTKVKYSRLGADAKVPFM